MKTCGFCASKITDHYCSFCDMTLTDRYVLQNGERLDNSAYVYPEKRNIFKKTSELLQYETIELLCLLKHARDFRSEVYNLRLLGHRAAEAGGDVEAIKNQSYGDYEEATRKVWVIENIIKDRIGYYPQKITANFLDMYLERIEKSQRKRMTIKKAVKK